MEGYSGPCDLPGKTSPFKNSLHFNCIYTETIISDGWS